jgi:23S rRNA pseudouridine955/2504/2580 synthase
MKDLSKDSVTWLEVGEDAEGQRIDNFLMRIAKGVPKSHIYRVLRSGEVRVNKGRVPAEYRLKVGDRLRVPPIRTAERPSQAAVPARDFDIAFEDEALIVVDKPSGVAVHGGSGVSFGVIEQLRRARPLAKFLELAHRLDRETSGLLVVAKKRVALTRLHDMFRDGGISKRYLALVKGLAQRTAARAPAAAQVSDGRRRAPGQRQAGGQVRTFHRAPGGALGKFQPGRGRTQDRPYPPDSGASGASGLSHRRRRQVRRFFTQQGLQKTGLGRMFLHAAKLALPHPLSGAAGTGIAAARGAARFREKLDRNETRNVWPGALN